MIDLDTRLAALVERAPEPPELGTVVRRAKQRRRRRRATALTTAIVVLAAGIGGAIAITTSRGTPRVTVVSNPIEHVRLTLLDGSQLEISGPQSLGLTTLAPAFNGSLNQVSSPTNGLGHGFSVVRTPPVDLGDVVNRYPTHDGHELVVHSTADGTGVDAVADYGDWWLSSYWGHDSTDWAQFAAALNVKETADGFLVVELADRPDGRARCPTGR